MFSRRFTRIISSGLTGLLLVVLLSGLPVLARSNLKLPVLEQPPLEVPQTAVSTPPADERGLNDPQEVGAFIDSILEEELEKSTTPGAVVSIVKDGEIFFANL